MGPTSRLTAAQRNHRAAVILGSSPNATATLVIDGHVVEQRCLVARSRIRLLTASFDRRGVQRTGRPVQLLLVIADDGAIVMDRRS